MFGMGFSEILLIFVIALIVFGPKRLPDLGRSIGRAMAEFKKAQQEFQDSMREEMKEVEKSADLEGIKKLSSVEIPDYNKTEESKPAGEQPAEQKPAEGQPDMTKVANQTNEEKNAKG